MVSFFYVHIFLCVYSLVPKSYVKSIVAILYNSLLVVCHKIHGTKANNIPYRHIQDRNITYICK